MNPNPVNKFGDRNYQCPLYEECHGRTVEAQWTFWTCADCEHKLAGTPVSKVGRKEPNMTAMQYGKFQIVSKKITIPYAVPIQEGNIPGEPDGEGSKPRPFRFH